MLSLWFCVYALSARSDRLALALGYEGEVFSVTPRYGSGV